MDYALEYALMSDIYDEMTAANEWFGEGFGINRSPGQDRNNYLTSASKYGVSILDKIIRFIKGVIEALGRFIKRFFSTISDDHKQLKYMLSKEYNGELLDITDHSIVPRVNDSIINVCVSIRHAQSLFRVVNGKVKTAYGVGDKSVVDIQKETEVVRNLYSKLKNASIRVSKQPSEESLNKWWTEMVVRSLNKESLDTMSDWLKKLQQSVEDTKHALMNAMADHPMSSEQVEKVPWFQEYTKDVSDVVSSVQKFQTTLFTPWSA